MTDIQTNELHDNLNLLQALSLRIVEQQNEHIDTFNQAVDEIEELRAKVEELQQLNQKIHVDRLAILDKHNAEVAKAQNEIDRLNSQVRKLQTNAENYRLQLDELQKTDPKRFERLYKTQKESNETLKAANEKLLRENADYKRYNQKLKSDIQLSLSGVWNFGQERIFPFMGNVAGIVDSETRVEVGNCVWWHHERGVRLLCGYNYEEKRIVLCDPIDEETGCLHIPSLSAEKAMHKYFEELRLAEEKEKKLSAKKAA